MNHVLITGGSRGIGKELVGLFARNGFKVSFIYNRSATAAEAIVKQLQEEGFQVFAHQCDIADEAAVKALFKANKEELSDVDVLINNAGIVGTARPFLLTTGKDWWEIVHNNIGGVLNFTKNVLPTMIRNKRGRIINVTSLSGLKGNPGMSAYASSKAAISAFSKSLSKELKGTGIIINCVAPGFIATDMTKDVTDAYYQQRMSNSVAQRMGTTEEAANLILYLAKDAPAYLVNQEIVLDGGIL